MVDVCLRLSVVAAVAVTVAVSRTASPEAVDVRRPVAGQACMTVEDWKRHVHLPHGCGVALAVYGPGFVILERMNSHTSKPLAPKDPPRSAGLALKLALLLDVRFERRFAPMLVRWLYIGSLALIGALTLFGLLMSWWLATWAGCGFWMGVPICIAGGLVGALGVRLVCEHLIRWAGPAPMGGGGAQRARSLWLPRAPSAPGL